ncbi:hypothetical protein F442_13841 [Phytophthora nicotianae P10297]|uniref:Uncharacterized protein n=4 Tax=Phytophthora nicotianae TaxID=4792 RepID=W2YV38_PHYNI|nr:hypothetical protein F444_14030 [Phytophthora nicotianae P1976]ETP38606.1 hypothetical protein F442_13841 [Phytophthora nicotianae P10297]
MPAKLGGRIVGDYKRGNVPHLNNNTNNRIKSKWGKIKDDIKNKFTIAQPVTNSITLQEYAEEQYIAEFSRVGGRLSGLNEDSEPVSLTLQISEFALEHVSAEHEDFTTNFGKTGNAVVRSPRPGKAYQDETALLLHSACNRVTRMWRTHGYGVPEELTDSQYMTRRVNSGLST